MVDVSVVIPTYNEQEVIGDSLRQLLIELAHVKSHEIMVVDHGSDDLTVQVADQMGVPVVDGKQCQTIGALRNLGVSKSKGRLLVFLDADIVVAEHWGKHLAATVKWLEHDDLFVTGSFPNVPSSVSFFVKAWFEPKVNKTATQYLGSGHLIVSRALFYRVDGFSSSLETSEDLDFCLRVVTEGGEVRPNPEMQVSHFGCPETLGQFIRREAWHGRGDFSNLSVFLSSKAAIVSTLFFLLHLCCLFLLVADCTLFPYPVVAIICLVVLSAFYKYRDSGLRYVAVNVITFYVYFLGRSFALLSIIFHRSVVKRERKLRKQ